ncbi:hypothetical protein GQ457_17G024850 [Hibiscus cannabinus]
MAAGLSAAVTPKPFRSLLSSHHRPNPTPVFSPLLHHQRISYGARRKTSLLSVCFVLEEQKHGEPQIKLARKRSERLLILLLLSCLASVSPPWLLCPSTIDFLGKWRAAERCLFLKCSVHLLYQSAPLWAWSFGLDGHIELSGMLRYGICTSLITGREKAVRAKRFFAITNAVPAIALLSYGFFNKGLFPVYVFGAGLGITVFGMAYMFVHDGLVHKRFPVGPIANVPYFRKVAAAHQLHHSEKFQGVPYGRF